MNTLIRYDVSKRQSDVKTALEALKYFDKWESNGRTYYLPYTTLWKKDISLKEALKEIQDAIARLNQGQFNSNQIELERCVCVPAYPWAAIPGKPHK
jgi:hypothetical protein